MSKNETIIITDIDRNSNSGFNELIRKAFGTKDVLYSSEELLKVFEELAELSEMDKRNIEILKRRFNLNGDNLSNAYKDIGEDYKLTGVRIKAIVDQLISRLKHPFYSKRFIYDTNNILKTEENVSKSESAISALEGLMNLDKFH